MRDTASQTVGCITPIDFFDWVRSHQRAETDLVKRSHMACIIKFNNLVQRQQALGRGVTSEPVVPKVGN